jgi:hypothetical protein
MPQVEVDVVYDLGNSQLTVGFLDIFLRSLAEGKSIAIRRCSGASILEIGAVLAEIAHSSSEPLIIQLPQKP